MRTIAIPVLAATALVAYKSAMLAAPAQTTRYPGQMTEARVWIQNRPDRDEAVPVRLERVGRDLEPLRVLITNGDPQPQRAPTLPALVRMAPQTWDYKTVYIGEGLDPAPALAKEGANGWEFAGVTWRVTNLTAWLMKRSRS
jgi:hypothetical protein